MAGYLARRFSLMILTLFGISVIIFVLLRLVPGNIADILFDSAGMINPAEKKQIEHELGLDRPIAVQYAQWIGGLMEGDLGYSYKSERPAIEEIVPRIPITAKLAALALAFSVLLGVPLGVISAQSAWDELLLLSVPAAAVGFRSSALLMRLTRSAMLEVLRQDYIRTARSKGASERTVNYHHALRNAILPLVTVIGIEAAFLIGGLIVTETVFNIPGVARFLVEAIRWRDYPIVQNLVMFIALIVVVANFIVDLLYAVLDPRIRYAR